MVNPVLQASNHAAGKALANPTKRLLAHLTEVFSARKHFSEHRTVKVSELKW